MTTKTLAAAAVAALALPAVADAKKPTKPTKTPKTQSVGFSAKGTGLTGLGLTDAGSSAFSLDLAKANKHARAALKLTKADLATAAATPFAAEGNGFRVKFDESVVDGADADTTVGLADVLATDRVKIVGKVTRTRTKAKGSKPAFTYSTIDIKQVVISRGEDS